MNIDVSLFTITTVLLAAALATVAWMWARLRKRVKAEQQLREEAEVRERQFAAEQERNRRLKQEMTNNIAHELKTPVSSIRGYLEILLGDRPVNEEQRRHFMERCYSQTLRLSDLINDVALINKLEEGNDLFTREKIDLCEQAEEAIKELRLEAEKHSITIENRLEEGMTVDGNGLLVYSIFRNLIENAIVYAGDGCQVGIESYKPSDGTHYYLRLYDTGRGVQNEFLPRLFDRFVRIEEGRSRKNGGTGLGLSIVKHAVLFHGGDIYVKNRDGGGLEFFFSLRRRAAE